MTTKEHKQLNAELEQDDITLSELLQQRYHGKIKLLTNADSIKDASMPHIIMFHSFNKHPAKLCQRIDMLYDAALEYGGRISFALADYDDMPAVLQCKSSWMDHLRTRYVRGEPGYLYAVDVAQRYYNFVGILGCEVLKDYCQQLLDGKLYRTEPIPSPAATADAPESYVQVVVADNYEELVEQCTQDVLFVCYADWCRFSQELMPLLEELGQRLQGVEAIALMKINVELNYLPIRYNVNAYPKVVYIRKDEKQNLIEYQEGPRTLDNLTRFVAKNATKELRDFDRNGKPKSQQT